jgi:DNA invertase Pin-like site-specific DNA recombinase
VFREAGADDKVNVVLHALRERERGADVGLFLHQQALDTTTPAGKAMFGMLAVFGELEREIIRERVNSGLARARAQGMRLGRPKVAEAVEDRIRELRADGIGIKATARQLRVGVGTVQRIDRELRSGGEASGGL